MRRRPLHALLVVLCGLAPSLLAPPAAAGPATVDLVASAARITYGEAVTISGTVAGGAGCTGGRAVELQWRAADAADFAPVAQATTAPNGTFALEQSPPHTGAFRALVPVAGSCIELASNEVTVPVRVFVDAAIPAGPTEAGSCIDVLVVTSPPKAGQTVDVQRRGGGAWSTIASGPTNGDGEARVETCLVWDDLGRARYRARWAAQDPLNLANSSAPLAFDVTKAEWMLRIDEIAGGRAVSVSVAEERAPLYRRLDLVPRTPASNQKLLLAMASLEVFGPAHRIVTRASTEAFSGGVVRGDLWILGRGDPLIGRSTLGDLAEGLAEAGVERITGSVIGSTTYFQQDWDAPGWNQVARDYVNRPTALSFEGNGDPDPEREAAAALTARLERLGVAVRGRPEAGEPPGGLEELASIESRPLRVLLSRMLRPSWNFAAEVLGKGLGAEALGPPGTIAKGAGTVQAWVRERGTAFTLFDNSGLSYDNRVTAAGIVDLLGQAEEEAWGRALRAALPTGGQGTLEDRLRDVQVRAKTGTLTDISALSGWVWAEGRGEWIEFSILCRGMSKSAATEIEDRIVRLLAASVG